MATAVYCADQHAVHAKTNQTIAITLIVTLSAFIFCREKIKFLQKMKAGFTGKRTAQRNMNFPTVGEAMSIL